jgi:hypothetical protein
MNAPERIQLNKFHPRDYQLPLFDAIENKGYKRVLAILPRRAGKDICAWNIMIRQALKRIAVYYYIFPTYAQAKKVIWNSITNDGDTFLDYIPKTLVKSQNSQEMKIVLVNGSIIQLVGSDNVDSLVGTNPYGVVFSEFALQDPRAYQFLRPVLLANDGWMLFISTPRGKNALWDLLQIAQQSKYWFCYIRSVAETKHISLAEIEKERIEGLMSDDLIQQEYFCFPAGQQVLTSTGCISIEDIKENDTVISHSGRLRKVMAVIERDYKGPLYHIYSYGSNDPIICTPDHPIRTYDQTSQKYSWKKASDITDTDKVVFPKMVFGDFEIINRELCLLIAWYITEGSCFKNGVQWTVKHSESITIRHLLSRLGLSYETFLNENVVNVVVYSTQLVDFFKSTCGLKADNKKIPFNLITGHEDAFFHELIKGDGCHNKDGEYERFCYSTVSRTLAYQVQLLANSLGLGYAAGITSKEAYEGTIQGRKVNCLKSYQINISFPPLRSHSGKLIRAKNSIAAKVIHISISPPFEGKVYNLKVQYDESYLIGGRAVHNCSFDQGVEGSYYSKYIDKMRLKGQIGNVPFEVGFKVHTAWDLGMRDSTTIIFFQCIGSVVHIIDCYENSKQGLEHYINVISNKGYTYGRHIAPHDIKVREMGTGMSRLEKARGLGISFVVAPDVSIMDGIESVRSLLSKVWIDEEKCALLIKSLENYRQEYDQKRKVYKANPLHDFSSHFADAMRYLAISLPKTRDGLSSEELDKRYQDAMIGPKAGFPAIFRDNLPRY